MMEAGQSGGTFLCPLMVRLCSSSHPLPLSSWGSVAVQSNQTRSDGWGDGSGSWTRKFPCPTLSADLGALALANSTVPFLVVPDLKNVQDH
jgi:hypothetical protein